MKCLTLYFLAISKVLKVSDILSSIAHIGFSIHAIELGLPAACSIISISSPFHSKTRDLVTILFSLSSSFGGLLV